MKVDIKGVYSNEGGNGMRIKTTKQMNLWQIIKHVQENDDLFNGKMELFFVSDDGRVKLEFDDSGAFQTDQWIDIDEDTFTVEVEEELTEETVFKELVITKGNKVRGTTIAWNCTIDDLSDDTEKFAVYAQAGGELILIWSKEQGIPEEGVIEA